MVVPIRLDSRSDRIASACRLSGPFGKSQALDASASNAAQCRFGSSKTDLKGRSASGAKRTFTEKLTSEKRQQEILLGCREDALPANGAPGSQLTCADWRAQGLRQRR